MNYLKYFLFLFLGFLVGKFITMPYFEVDKNINIVDISGLFVTLGAAYWISKVIDKEKQDNRTEKDLFLKRSDGIAENIRDFSVKVSSGTISLNEVASTCKRINVSIDSLYNALKASNYNCDQIAKSYLILSVNNLKNLLTTTPISGMAIADTEIQILSGIITVTGTKLNTIENEFETLKNRFLKFQIEVNKL